MVFTPNQGLGSVPRLKCWNHVGLHCKYRSNIWSGLQGCTCEIHAAVWPQDSLQWLHLQRAWTRALLHVEASTNYCNENVDEAVKLAWDDSKACMLSVIGKQSWSFTGVGVYLTPQLLISQPIGRCSNPSLILLFARLLSLYIWAARQINSSSCLMHICIETTSHLVCALVQLSRHMVLYSTNL